MRKRFLGDTKHFCPVALQELGVLWPGDPDKAAVYRNKIYYFSKDEARDKFIKNPKNFTAGMHAICGKYTSLFIYVSLLSEIFCSYFLLVILHLLIFFYL